MVLAKNFKQTDIERVTADLLVRQNYFDPSDKYQTKKIGDAALQGGKSIKEVSEFLKGRIYYSRVCVVNTSAKKVKASLIHEIPKGAIAVSTTRTLDIIEIDLQPFRTEVREFAFYFPEAGKFERYPASLIVDKKLATRAEGSKVFLVVEKFEVGSKKIESFEDVFNYGTEDQMVEYIRNSNLHGTESQNLHKIYWMLKNSSRYKEIMGILRSQAKFDDVVWQYSLKNNHEQAILELLESRRVP